MTEKRRCRECIHYHKTSSMYGYCDRPNKQRECDKLGLRRPHVIASPKCFERKRRDFNVIDRKADEKEWRCRFVDRLKKAMDDNDMIAADLAEEIGVAESTILKYLRHSITPSFYNVMLISEVLNVRLEEFI